jgi:hypothetical protein
MSERRPQSESELIDHIRSIDERAPEGLHRTIDALVAERVTSSRRTRWPSALGARSPLGFKLGGAVAALAVVAVVLVVGLSGGGATALSVRQASTLTLRAATMSAPAQSASDPRTLDVAVDGVAFPYWEDRFGWRSSGARVDHLGGRMITTVFYTNARGQRIGYAIVAGTPAPASSGGRIVWRHGTRFRLTQENGVQVVTWTREGHLCVVSGGKLPAATLLRLASWNDADVSA